MRIPISWLRDYVDVDHSPEELAELITNAGMEVNTIDFVGLPGAPLEWDRERVLLCRVIGVRQHPNADRLVIAEVEYGEESSKEVVTGAPNLFPLIDDDTLAERDVMSALILEGATYLDPYKDGKPTRLKGKELRGVYNDAMLCSPVEIALGEDHEGILLFERSELPGGAPSAAGTPLADVLGDAVLDVDIIPNIARCASIVGIAREVAALTGKELRLPPQDVLQEGPAIDGRVVVETTEPELNPRFSAFLVEGVQQKPAPLWMQHRLSLAGQRPINVVVDISNYVMLEIGQPNHTFDWDFLRRRADQIDADGPVRIVTRLAEPGEKLTTLDGAEHELRPNHILVTDPVGNLSLGGVMGGRDSEIQPETTNVLLEAAAWKFTNIRQTQRELGLHTEAGFRFSRGVHPNQTMVGARRAAELLRTLAGGTVAQGHVDSVFLESPAVEVRLTADFVNQRSGLELDSGQIAECLERLEFAVDGPDDEGVLTVTVPDHRLDVDGPHDLVEEVCRMIGYDQLPSTVLSSTLPPQRGNRELEFEEEVRDRLAAAGLHELITYRLTTRENEARLNDPAVSAGAYVEVTNPSTQERTDMRRSLLASVLDIAARNARFRDTLRLFEVGRVFLPRDGETLPDEPTRVALLLAGPREAESWQSSDEVPAHDFFDLKGVVESVLSGMRVPAAEYRAAQHTSYRPGRCAEVWSGDQLIGRIGELHPLVAEAWELSGEVLVGELELDALLTAASEQHLVEPTPVYPAIREDLAFLVDDALPAGDLTQTLREAGGQLLESVELFDLYHGESLGAGRKSLAYRLVYRSPKKTLREKDATKLRRRLVQAATGIGAELRE